MKKIMLKMLVGVAVLFGLVFGIKGFQLIMEKRYVKKHSVPIITVSAAQASTSLWQSDLVSTGSLRTVKGVNVTTELGGMIRSITFKPGSDVKAGTVLVSLDIDPDIAKLHELEANALYAKITYDRDKKQYSFGAVSQETLAQDEASYESTAALVEEQKATIDKKIIRAPFSGRLGISQVNPGQYLNPGDAIVNLQTLDPIYVDFYLPQQQVSKIFVGQPIKMTLEKGDATYDAKITTINPIVDTDIRNVEVEATVPNPKAALLPGMFSNIDIKAGRAEALVTLPQMGVTFNPYGSIVYILKKTDQASNGKPVWQATSEFVTTGETRGNQVSILKGLKAGDYVVTSGQLKIKTGSLVVINDQVVPSDNPNPHPPEH